MFYYFNAQSICTTQTFFYLFYALTSPPTPSPTSPWQKKTLTTPEETSSPKKPRTCCTPAYIKPQQRDTYHFSFFTSPFPAQQDRKAHVGDSLTSNHQANLKAISPHSHMFLSSLLFIIITVVVEYILRSLTQLFFCIKTQQLMQGFIFLPTDFPPCVWALNTKCCSVWKDKNRWNAFFYVFF